MKYICKECGAKMSVGAELENVRCPLCRVEMQPEGEATTTDESRQSTSNTDTSYPSIKVAKPVTTLTPTSINGPKNAPPSQGASQASAGPTLRKASPKPTVTGPAPEEDAQSIVDSARRQAEELAADIIHQAETEAADMLEIRRAEVEKAVAPLIEKAKTEAKNILEPACKQAEEEKAKIIETAKTEAQKQAAKITEEAEATRKKLEDERKAFEDEQKSLENQKKSIAEDRKNLDDEKKKLDEQRKKIEEQNSALEDERKKKEEKQEAKAKKQAEMAQPADKPEENGVATKVNGDRNDGKPEDKDELRNHKAQMDEVAKREARFLMLGLTLSLIMLMYIVFNMISTRLTSTMTILSWVGVLIDVIIAGTIGWIIFGHYNKGKAAIKAHKERLQAKRKKKTAENKDKKKSDGADQSDGADPAPAPEKRMEITGAKKPAASIKQPAKSAASEKLKAAARRAAAKTSGGSMSKKSTADE